MKKSLILFSVAALALVSCAKVQDVYTPEAQEIGFQALNQPVTKAAIQTTTFPDQSMDVVAYLVGGGNYFEKTTFSNSSYATAGSTWKGGRYWPLSASTLNFMAVTGATATAHNTFAAAAAGYNATATVAYTTANGYDEDSQIDVMYAVGQGKVVQTAGGNTLSFGTDGKVSLPFQHALALIKFQVKGNSSVETSGTNAITITKIELNGAHYTGTLLVTNGDNKQADAAQSVASVAWTTDAAVVNDVAIPVILNQALTNTYAPADNDTWAARLIVPGAAYGFNNFKVTYVMDSKTYTYTYYPSGSSATDTYVEAGKVYNYQLNFKLHEIEVSPSVNDWTAPTPAIGAIDIQ